MAWLARHAGEAHPLNQFQARDTGPWLMGSAIVVRVVAILAPTLSPSRLGIP
jgi:hypothetical protein